MSEYEKLKTLDEDDSSVSIHDLETAAESRSRSWKLSYGKIFLVLSLLLNIALTSRTLFPPRETDSTVPKDFAEGVEIPTVYKRFWWNTEYSSTNETQQDELWDAILPSHGFVAVDREWAAERHYPESMYLPGDKKKGVYLLEAYHQLHCLKILRLTMKEAVNHLPYTWHPGEHIDHCFDTLRQTAMCHADTTPLYTFGDNTAGVAQYHKCRDWDTLRKYATENSACYRDSVEDILLGQHFGYCDDGDDGLVEGNPIRRAVD